MDGKLVFGGLCLVYFHGWETRPKIDPFFRIGVDWCVSLSTINYQLINRSEFSPNDGMILLILDNPLLLIFATNWQYLESTNLQKTD
jgi:hypothetical protein